MDLLAWALPLHQRARSLTRGIQAEASRIATLPYLASNAEASWDQRMVDAVRVPAEGFERAGVALAMSRFPEEAGWFPLLSESVLHELVAEGLIERDSFEYSVCYHHVSELSRAIEQSRRTAAATSKFFRELGVLAASQVRRVLRPAERAKLSHQLLRDGSTVRLEVAIRIRCASHFSSLRRKGTQPGSHRPPGGAWRRMPGPPVIPCPPT